MLQGWCLLLYLKTSNDHFVSFTSFPFVFFFVLKNLLAAKNEKECMVLKLKKVLHWVTMATVEPLIFSFNCV